MFLYLFITITFELNNTPQKFSLDWRKNTISMWKKNLNSKNFLLPKVKKKRLTKISTLIFSFVNLTEILWVFEMTEIYADIFKNIKKNDSSKILFKSLEKYFIKYEIVNVIIEYDQLWPLLFTQYRQRIVSASQVVALSISIDVLMEQLT